MGIKTKRKMAAIRVHNKTRSCVLVWKAKNEETWYFPTIRMSPKKDPYVYIMNELNNIIVGDIKLSSLISMVDMLYEKGDDTFHCVVYDLRYSGKIEPKLPEGLEDICEKAQWLPIEALRQKTKNLPTKAFFEALDKEQCLR